MDSSVVTAAKTDGQELNPQNAGDANLTGDQSPVFNPATGEIIAYVPNSSSEDVNSAVAAAKAAFETWRISSDEERRAVCRKIATKIEEHAEELATLVAKETGKAIGGFGARFEVGASVGWTGAAAELSLEGRTIKDDETGRTVLEHEPIGVCGSITPWNWPLMIAVWHIIPALRTGNTVVIKPSENAPLSTLRFVELIDEVAPGLVHVVTGQGDVGAKLSAHEDIAKIVFTGSLNTGRRVMEASASNFKRLTLELGGNDAGIILPGTDIASLVEPLFWGAFMHSGQTCAALKRLYVHADQYDEVCEALVAFSKTVPMGDPLDESTMLGPLQNPKQLAIVESLVEDAKANGGRVLIGGERTPGPGNFYPITFVADMTDGIRLVDEEQFGPALPIIKYTNLEEVISAANGLEFGLAASVWSQDSDKAMEVATRLEAGTVYINKHADISPDTPFGGVKSSGLGVEFGPEGLAAYTNIKIYSVAG